MKMFEKLEKADVVKKETKKVGKSSDLQVPVEAESELGDAMRKSEDMTCKESDKTAIDTRDITSTQRLPSTPAKHEESELPTVVKEDNIDAEEKKDHQLLKCNNEQIPCVKTAEDIKKSILDLVDKINESVQRVSAAVPDKSDSANCNNSDTKIVSDKSVVKPVIGDSIVEDECSKNMSIKVEDVTVEKPCLRMSLRNNGGLRNNSLVSASPATTKGKTRKRAASIQVSSKREVGNDPQNSSSKMGVDNETDNSNATPSVSANAIKTQSDDKSRSGNLIVNQKDIVQKSTNVTRNDCKRQPSTHRVSFMLLVLD